MKIRFVFATCLALGLAHGPLARAVSPSAKEPLPNYDKRKLAPLAKVATPDATQDQAIASLKAVVPSAQVTLDRVLGTPSWITAQRGFLTGPGGQGGAVSRASIEAVPSSDKNRIVKAFINEHAALLGHDANALDSANVTRDYITPHNGLHTVVWEQTQDNIPVFESLLVAHVTRAGELVSLADHFVPNPANAAEAGTPNHAAVATQPSISASKALLSAAANIGSVVSDGSIQSVKAPEGAEQKQTLKTDGLLGPAYAQLVWFPLDRDNLRLAWRVILNGKPQPDRYLVLVDAQNGEVLLRYSLTEHITPATYNVYTSDSPSPFSPSWPVPNPGQPALTNRVKVTTPALDTNASPAGWIPDDGNTTTGNN
ncbi:MAG TPA: hypothetical protein VHI52_19835, partial [Verrucomicrobiae bacterium]|nr:hypothetical protein [Verrucomicrobiae bacterium]